MAQWLTNQISIQISIHKDTVFIRCRELWWRSQTQLGFSVAVAVAQAGSYSSDSTRSLGTSICHWCSPKKTKEKRKKEKKEALWAFSCGAAG